MHFRGHYVILLVPYDVLHLMPKENDHQVTHWMIFLHFLGGLGSRSVDPAWVSLWEPWTGLEILLKKVLYFLCQNWEVDLSSSSEKAVLPNIPHLVEYILSKNHKAKSLEKGHLALKKICWYSHNFAPQKEINWQFIENYVFSILLRGNLEAHYWFILSFSQQIFIESLLWASFIMSLKKELAKDNSSMIWVCPVCSFTS